ncbi:MAG: alpha-L-fucosidase [Anaerolineae bacterium]|jgi:alpha-L-fucosidase
MASESTSSQNRDRRLDWFREAKFGLFIHWGPYSVAGVEASWPVMVPELAAAAFGEQSPISEAEYLALPQRFNPVDFEPRAWVQMAQEAGMRYIVFTAKHHDGFCMFDAPGTDYQITNTPYGQDVCAELAHACAEAGMRLCFYYSQPDMHHAGYRDTSQPCVTNWQGEPERQEWAGYLDYMEGHLRKLLSDYGQVSALWFDGLASFEKYDPARFYRLIRELSPTTLINDRLGPEYDFVTAEQFIPRRGIPIKHKRSSPSDASLRLMLSLFRVPGIDRLLKKLARSYAQGDSGLASLPTASYPSQAKFQPWETCLTMNQTWAYNPTDKAYKSAARLIVDLVETASRGGNFLLNIGPSPQGTFPPEAIDRLHAMGRWMAVNGESIHGTTYGPLQHLLFGRTTAEERTIYLHVWDWPSSAQISLGAMPGAVTEVRLLAGDETLPFHQAGNQFTIEVPGQAPDPAVSVLAISLKPGWNRSAP